MEDKYLLNGMNKYVPKVKRELADDVPLVWDAKAAIHTLRTHMSPAKFEKIFETTLDYVLETEHHSYMEYQKSVATENQSKAEKDFDLWLDIYLKRNHPDLTDTSDINILKDRLHTAIFKYHVLQPLIDNPDTSDIKVCRYDDIRVRVKGKAYRSNVNFLNNNDLYSFIEGLALRNRLNFGNNPMITFTDLGDKNYILRFLVNTPMVNTDGLPSMHIRKVPRDKPDFEKLIEDKMLTPVVRDYLIDKAKTSKAVVFAGPPGSGKTTALNAFIEYIPKTRETLVIQENDELHTKQSGFLFKHVTHAMKAGEKEITLADLGQMALVEGCNEFIIGEVKGGEMRAAMTLLNTGSYIAFTVHSNSAKDTIDRLADLVKYGSDYSYQDARKMLKSMDVIVYMEQYQIQEILEVADYDEASGQYVYRYIYKNEHPRWEKKAEAKEEDLGEKISDEEFYSDEQASDEPAENEEKPSEVMTEAKDIKDIDIFANFRTINKK